MGDSGSLFLGLLFGLVSLLLLVPGDGSLLPDRGQRRDPRRAAPRYGARVHAAARHAASRVRGRSPASAPHAPLPFPLDEKGRSRSLGARGRLRRPRRSHDAGERRSPSAPRSRSSSSSSSSRFGHGAFRASRERSKRRYSAAAASPRRRTSPASASRSRRRSPFQLRFSECCDSFVLERFTFIGAHEESVWAARNSIIVGSRGDALSMLYRARVCAALAEAHPNVEFVDLLDGRGGTTREAGGPEARGAEGGGRCSSASGKGRSTSP